jgi:hypothetical protein
LSANSAFRTVVSQTDPLILSDAELLEAYRRTVWTVDTPAGVLELRLDGAAPDDSLRPSGIITAYNPASMPRADEDNRAADQELMRHVRSLGVPFRRTEGRSPISGEESWTEPGFLLLGDVRPLLVELGLVFGQNAVVWVDGAGAVSLVCTRAGFAGRRPGQKIDL